MTTILPFQSQQPVFGKVGGIYEIVHMSEEERIKNNVSLDTYRTSLAVMKNERMEGYEEGFKKGYAEGFKKGYEEGYKKGCEEWLKGVARKMILDKMPVELIEKYTGLSKEIIETL